MRAPENFTILVVDDEEAIAKLLKINFEMDGYNVLTASSGNKALEIVLKTKIDFIISDIRMPDGDGEMLLEKVRELNPELPVIVMVTGYAELDKEAAIKKGALDLMAKPIDIDQLEKYVLECLKASK